VAVNFKNIDKRLFCGTSRGKIAWYEVKNNKLVKETEFTAHLDSVRTVNYHPNKKILLSTGRDGSVRLWNAESNTHHPRILGNLALHS
jgi:WD40 repeat protein